MTQVYLRFSQMGFSHYEVLQYCIPLCRFVFQSDCVQSDVSEIQFWIEIKNLWSSFWDLRQASSLGPSLFPFDLSLDPSLLVSHKPCHALQHTMAGLSHHTLCKPVLIYCHFSTACVPSSIQGPSSWTHIPAMTHYFAPLSDESVKWERKLGSCSFHTEEQSLELAGLVGLWYGTCDSYCFFRECNMGKLRFHILCIENAWCFSQSCFIASRQLRISNLLDWIHDVITWRSNHANSRIWQEKLESRSLQCS